VEIPDEPTDILGLAMHRVINKNINEDSNYKKFIEKLNENIVISTDYYDLMLKFKDGEFEVTREIKDPTIIVKITIEEFFKIMDKKTSMMISFLKGRMKFKKGLFKVLKVYKLFSKVFN